MRSRMPRALRRTLDRILTSPSWRTGLKVAVLACVVGVGALLWDLRHRVAPGIRARDQEIASLRDLEADLVLLRARASGESDSLERRAWEGVFVDWADLAGWLETVRSHADSAQGDIEWRVQEGGVADPRFPALREVRVEWTYSPSDPSFRQALGFVQRHVVDKKRLVSLESVGMEGDEIGIRTVRFRLKAWILGSRG